MSKLVTSSWSIRDMSHEIKAARKDEASRPADAVSFTEFGQLASGIHDLTLAELRALVATSAYRRMMWGRFLDFLEWSGLAGDFSHIYIGGGFVSNKEEPRDIDLVLQTRCPFGPHAFQALERFFGRGLEAIYDAYSTHLHFWMDNAPTGFSDFRAFFQYARPEKPKQENSRRALVRISVRQADFRQQFKQEREWLDSTNAAS